MKRTTTMSGWVAAVVVVLAAPTFGASAEIDWNLEPITPDLEDQESLQRGLRLYTNFCLSCHSLKFQRYERTADDLGIPHEIALENVVFTGQKIGGLMATSMSPDRAKRWFGAPPPDLTMTTRVRGVEWLYNYLKTFYVDESRPFGVNNKVFPNVGMPHALLALQGVPREVCRGYEAIDILDGEGIIGAERKPLCNDIAVDAGTGLYSEEEYDRAVYDIVNFLHYVGEPSRLERINLGYYVIGFLVLLFFLASMLNREYWKDVH